MKKLHLIVLLTLFGGMLMGQNYSFVATKTGKALNTKAVASKLKKYDVVFFGEYHDNADVHAAQKELLDELYKANKHLSLSFEMFERDVQSLLNEYLLGSISEDEFLSNSRPWPNYVSDYKPLVEFAKINSLPCIAANVPRRLAGKAARNGISFRESLTAEETILVAQEVTNSAGKYQERFFQTMSENGMHGSAEDTELLNNLFLAQCLKDDTMAESIVKHQKANPKNIIMHFNGDFHSREFLGTVERCKSREPKLRIAVISPIFKSDSLPGQDEEIATYYLVIPDLAVEESKSEGTQ